MYRETLLAIENLCQRMRTTELSPKGIEGICRHASLFADIGDACRHGRLTTFELERFIRQHLRIDRDPTAPTFELRVSGATTIDTIDTTLRDRLVWPIHLEQFFRGNIRFTREQLRKLECVPWDIKTLGKERYDHYAILFPGHPDITLPFLVKAFAANIGATVSFRELERWVECRAEDSDETGQVGLELGWYLVRCRPEPILGQGSFLEQARRIDHQTFRMPRVVEFVTAALLSRWRLNDSDWGLYPDKIRPSMQFGTWCSEGPEETSKADRWVVGPYEHKNLDTSELPSPVGLCLSKLKKTKRVHPVQLFLVRKPDIPQSNES